MLSWPRWLRILDIASQVRARLNLRTIRANCSKISFVVDQDGRIFRHLDDKLAEIYMRCIGHVARHRQPTEIDGKRADIG